MHVYKVALIDIGEYLPLSLKNFSKELDSMQVSFYFEEAGSITSDVLGNPDVDDDWYDVSTMFNLMKKKISSDDYHFIVGITQSKITDKTELAGKTEKDYFSQSDLQQHSIISVNKQVLKYNSPNKGNNKYVAHLLMNELLRNLAKKSLNHLGQKPCLFNECEDRSILSECIEQSRICHNCLAELKKNNVSDSILKDVSKILAWCRLNSWEFAFKNILQHPFSVLGLGIGLGWFTSVFITKEYYPIILAITILPVFIVFLLSRFSKLN